MNKLLYPEWTTVIHTDFETYEGFKSYFEGIRSPKIDIVVCANEPLCKAMLWRMKPIFEMNGGERKYTYVICRDADSPATYREVQAVEQWIANNKSAHAITDSISHNIPMLGGMIGFKPADFTMRVDAMDWNELMAKSGGISFSIKGSDQDFLNSVVYPKFAQHGNDSITQHYFNGCANSFLSDFHTCTCIPTVGHRDDCPNNFKINLPDDLKDSNVIVGHIGASGPYQVATERFLRNYRNQFDSIVNAEANYPDVFYWVKDKSLG
jgi:hypothetical protein